MNTFWVLILLMDDGSGKFQYSQLHSQYQTKAECITRRDDINQNEVRNARAECFRLNATKE